MYNCEKFVLWIYIYYVYYRFVVWLHLLDQTFSTFEGVSDVNASISFPHLDNSELDSNEKKIVTLVLHESTECITDAFVTSVVLFFNALEKYSVPAEKVGKTISAIILSQQVQLPKDHQEKLLCPISMDDIHNFLIKHKYISFLNFKLLEMIIKKLGKPEDTARMDVYVSKLREFSKRRVFEVPSEAFKNQSSDSGEKVVVKVKNQYLRNSGKLNLTVQDLQDIRGILEKVTGCSLISIHDVKIEEATHVILTVPPAYLPFSKAHLRSISRAGLEIVDLNGKQVKSKLTHSLLISYCY